MSLTEQGWTDERGETPAVLLDWMLALDDMATGAPPGRW